MVSRTISSVYEQVKGLFTDEEPGEIGPIREFINDNFMKVVLFPPITLLGILVAFPVGYLIWTSVHSISRYGGQEFIGLQNYVDIFQDPMFFMSLRHSILYTLGSVTLAFLIGFTCALALNKIVNQRIRSSFTVLILLAWAVPLVVTGLIWRFMLHADYGVVNAILVGTGITSENLPFVTEPTLAFISVVIVDAWSRAPFATIILLAGLQTIPDTLYEAATVDGATDFAKFRDITLPQIKPSAGVALLIMTMFAFRTFSIVFSLTQGGPGNATEVLATYIYSSGVKQLRLGYSAALSIVMILMTLIIVALYVKMIQEDALETA
ncbi:carbohydrate ABC transporter permease [Halomicrococcus sp. NG-SE-24]|uniref:carbohydrate ABC transporter permease n=1 Tax=Halomicrococcus sp. NG-SE-24 TaxID=3436928 RepID=UPI003D995F85